MRTGGVEPPQREASRLQRGELAGCSASARGRGGERLQPLSWVTRLPRHATGGTRAPAEAGRRTLGVAGRGRTGTAGFTVPGAAVTPRPPWSGDDRTRTGAFSPDKRALSPLSHAPVEPSCAGGIRTHGLELMRLARTATPLPRCVPSFPNLAGRSRTCDLRRPKPVGWPSPLRPVVAAPPAGLEPAASGLRARRHRLSTTGAWRFSSGGRVRTCASRLTVARLADSTTPEREEGEGVEPSRPGGPPVFETGYRAGGSPSRR
jgi:hypothetical protein